MANKAAADSYSAAVALAEPSAAFVSFQRQQASLPPDKNVDSAVSPLLPAGQFSGKYAQNAAKIAFCAYSAS